MNNVYIFPGLSFGLVSCAARTVPDELFLVAAEAVANSLSKQDVADDRVVPDVSRIREVSLNVAAAVAYACARLGLADEPVPGDSVDDVRAVLKSRMWLPKSKSKL